MFKLNAHLLASRRLRTLSFAYRALTWWARELVAIVPPRLRDWLDSDDLHPVLRIDLNDERTHEPFDPAITVDGFDIVNLSPALRARIERLGCILMLPKSRVLRQTLELPLAAADEVVAASSFLIEGITPFARDQVRYSCIIIEKNRRRQVVKVEITVVPDVFVDACLKQLKARKLSVSGFRVVGDKRDLSLTPSAHKLQGSTHRASCFSRPWKLTIATAVILLTAGTPLIVAQVHGQAAVLNAKVSAAEKAGQNGSALRAEVEALTAVSDFIPDQISGPYAIEVLAELTELLPDDTWLFNVDMTPSEVRIAGLSATIPTVLERLRNGRAFGAPELLGSVVHGSERERFEIGLHIMRPQS